MTEITENIQQRPKVLLLVGILSSYRVPIYNIINEYCDLTVGYDVRDESKGEVSFSKLKLETRQLGPLKFHKKGFRKLCNSFDAVIFIADMHYVSYISLPFLPRRNKLLTWTPGIRASYTCRFDLNRPKTLKDKVYFNIIKRCDALIFYMKAVEKFWDGYGLNTDKVFAAHNTVEVLPLEEKDKGEKDSVLFVGTLYKEKNIYELVNAYVDAFEKNPDVPVLRIVGDGAEMEPLRHLVEEKKLEKKVELLGRIMDENRLRSLFAKAFICVSPNQAGLSVLKSFGYGVPFITRANAITGGEILNIIDGQNGLLYDDYQDLVNIIADIPAHPEKYKALGDNAFRYYQEHATPALMAKGVTDALAYCGLKSSCL